MNSKMEAAPPINVAETVFLNTTNYTAIINQRSLKSENSIDQNFLKYSNTVNTK